MYGDGIEAVGQARVEGLTKRKTPRKMKHDFDDIEYFINDTLSEFYPPVKGVSEVETRVREPNEIKLPDDKVKTLW